MVGRANRTVCVLNAASFLGTELVHQLLSTGHDIRAVVNRISNARVLDCIFQLQSAHPGRIEVYECDPLSASSYLPAFDEVFIPEFFAFIDKRLSPDEWALLTKRAVQSVVDSAGKAGSVSRIIMANPLCTVFSPSCLSVGEKIYTPEDWNTVSTLDDSGMSPVWATLTIAERFLWETSLENTRMDRITLQSVVHGFLLGPPYANTVNSPGVSLIYEWMRKGRIEFSPMCVSDVRDVSAALIQAGEIPNDNLDSRGRARYICCTPHRIHPAFFSQTLQSDSRYTVVMSLRESNSEIQFNSSATVDISKACRDLGYPNISNMNYTPLRQTILDMAAVYSEEGKE